MHNRIVLLVAAVLTAGLSAAAPAVPTPGPRTHPAITAAAPGGGAIGATPATHLTVPTAVGINQDRIEPAVAAVTDWNAMNAAIARIPGYSSHRPAVWHASSRYSDWGTTNLGTGEVWINPNAPVDKLDSIVRHEWAHVLQAREWNYDYGQLGRDLAARFGGADRGGLGGVERAADCMALQLGATWTYYTTCTNPQWQADAAAMLNGHRPGLRG